MLTHQDPKTIELIDAVEAAADTLDPIHTAGLLLLSARRMRTMLAYMPGGEFYPTFGIGPGAVETPTFDDPPDLLGGSLPPRKPRTPRAEKPPICPLGKRHRFTKATADGMACACGAVKPSPAQAASPAPSAQSSDASGAQGDLT